MIIILMIETLHLLLMQVVFSIQCPIGRIKEILLWEGASLNIIERGIGNMQTLTY